MKYILVFFMIIFSYGNIIETKVFTKIIKSNTLNTVLAISLEDKNIANLVSKIDKTLKIANKYNFCKNDGYSIMPKFYKNKFDTYNTKLKLNCQFTDKKIDLFSKFLAQVQKNNIIYIYDLKYIIPKKLQKDSIKLLKIEALNYALKKAKKLSTTFNKKCFMQKVNFNNYNTRMLFKSVSMYQKSIPLPQNHGKNIEIKANYNFVCY